MAKTGQAIGGEFLVYIEGTAIGSCKNGTINIERDMIPSVTKSSTANWESNRPSTQRWSIDFDGLYTYDETYGIDDVFALQIAGTQVSIKFSPNTSGNGYYHGEAFSKSVTMEAPDEGNVSFSGSFTGAGALAFAEQT